MIDCSDQLSRDVVPSLAYSSPLRVNADKTQNCTESSCLQNHLTSAFNQIRDEYLKSA